MFLIVHSGLSNIICQCNTKDNTIHNEAQSEECIYMSHCILHNINNKYVQVMLQSAQNAAWLDSVLADYG